MFVGCHQPKRSKATSWRDSPRLFQLVRCAMHAGQVDPALGQVAARYSGLGFKISRHADVPLSHWVQSSPNTPWKASVLA